MARVRVRGIAATALTKILSDAGHVIVQASRVIQERMGIHLNTSPADVTVKDAGPDELLVIGFPQEARRVFNDLVGALRYVFTWVPKLYLHAAVVGRIVEKRDGTCVIELPNGLKGELQGCSGSPGDLVTVTVAKAPIKPGEAPRLTKSIRVVGEYVALIRGSTRLSVSEHIRDHGKRQELIAAATAAVMGRGLGVHIRSSAAYASPSDIVEEIKRLEEKLSDVVERASSCSEPCVVYEGEFVGLLGLTSEAKRLLDEYRGAVVPTVRGHHSYKTFGSPLSDVVDYAEMLLSKGDAGRGVARDAFIEDALKDFVLSRITSGQRVSIIHIRPDGEVLELTPGRVETTTITGTAGDRVRIRIKRIMRGGGAYDGLGAEKKPGDYDEMIVEEGRWLIIHNYRRADGSPIGVYVNINTPPEILPGTIKYHDLAVDVVAKPGEEPMVIDLDELDKYREEGIVTEELYRRAREAVEEALSLLRREAGVNNKNLA